VLKDWDVEVSMNGGASWYDNPPVESFFATLKTEQVHHRTYRTPAEARADIFFYIQAFYNRRRIHSALGYVSPAHFEMLYHQRAAVHYLPVHQTGGSPPATYLWGLGEPRKVRSGEW